MSDRLSTALLFLLFVVALVVGTGCTPKIGSACTLSTDCSTQGTRVCDTAQPGGYCTEINCTSNMCPKDSECVLFNAAVQGCAINDQSPSRTGRSYCLATCSSNSDCRDGYICAQPTQGPWDAVILDNDQDPVCVFPPYNYVVGGDAGLASDAAVCQAGGPSVPGLDAAVTFFVDAGADASADAGLDAGSEGGQDAGADAERDAGVESGVGEGGVTDAGPADGPTGG